MSPAKHASAGTPHAFGLIWWLTYALLSPIVESRASAVTPRIGQLQFLGEAHLEKNLRVDGALVGGLSGITFDSHLNTFFVISDDPGVYSPARFFTLQIDLSDGALDSGDIHLEGVTYLESPSGQQFPAGVIDAEGFAFTPEGTLLVSSEGQANELIDPFIREFRTDGSYLRSIKIPKKYLPQRRRQSGVRHNLAFESLSVSPDGEYLFAATENALIQDGPESDLGIRSPARILRYELTSGKLLAEYLYFVEAVAETPAPAAGFRVNGLVDILAIDESSLLALERSYSEGMGNDIRLYLVRLEDATNIRKKKRLAGRTSGLVPARKDLLLDFTDLGLMLDNLEGMTWGPILEDGRRTVILVTDDNFNPDYQVTQFYAFALEFRSPSISEIQGHNHRSPMENAWVAGISGVVTRVVVSQDSKGSNSETKFWIQAPQGDGDITTADALSVILKDSKSAPEIAIGDQVSVSGRVAETGRSGSLTLTQIVAATVAVVATDQALPAPIVLGHEGYSVPTDHVDDDGLSSFQPTSDAIDFFESIEGMRVALQDPVVVGATSRFGDFTIVTDRGVDSGPRTSRGGVLIGAEDLNPERIQVSPSRTATPSHLDVGDQFLGPITGVLGYAFGSFRVMVTERLPPVQPSTPSKKSPTPATCPTGSNGSMTSDTSGAFTVATFNVENLGGQSDVEKFERLAQIVVLDLGSPDLIALQEIQDNSGPEDDGTVAADQTFERLIKAISEVGGPSYSYVQIDPADGREGGQPGGNIRVGYLFDPHRVRFSRSLQTESRTAATLELGNIGLALAANPALLGILEPAFNEDLDAGLRPSRKPLVAEFWVGPHQIFVINVHLKSKRGDQPLFGNTQPPQRASELQRTLQARVIADFVARLLDQDPNANVIVLGDFNEHEFRSTVEPLRRVGLENLIERVPAPERYTHVYKGNSQVLDQVFVSRHLLETGRPEIQILHVNADFSAQTRSSDHDPILVRLELDARLEFAQ